MIRLFKVYSPEGYDVDFCAVEVTPEYASHLLFLIHAYDDVAEKVESLNGMDYWDYTPDWFTHSEEMADLFLGDNGEDYEEVDFETFDPPSERIRTTCEQLHVDSRGVYWSMIRKHCDGRLDPKCAEMHT